MTIAPVLEEKDEVLIKPIWLPNSTRFLGLLTTKSVQVSPGQRLSPSWFMAVQIPLLFELIRVEPDSVEREGVMAPLIVLLCPSSRFSTFLPTTRGPCTTSSRLRANSATPPSSTPRRRRTGQREMMKKKKRPKKTNRPTSTTSPTSTWLSWLPLDRSYLR